MFGYYALKDKIDDQNEAIRGFHLTIKSLEESLDRIGDCLQSLKSGEHYKSFSTSFADAHYKYEQTLKRWENLNDNISRFNSMINEFKGLVSLVRGEVATKPPKASKPRGRPKKNVEWPSTDIKENPNES